MTTNIFVDEFRTSPNYFLQVACSPVCEKVNIFRDNERFSTNSLICSFGYPLPASVEDMKREINSILDKAQPERKKYAWEAGPVVL